MPQWETKLGNERIMLLAAYIYSLSDKGVPTAKAAVAANAPAPKAVASAN